MKIKTKLQTISNENKSEDRRKGGLPNDPQRTSWSGTKRSNANGGRRNEPDKPIPWKTPVTAKREQYKLCQEYGGQSKSHTTTQCRKWVVGGKSHSKWRGRRTANMNVHQDSGVNQLMAQ